MTSVATPRSCRTQMDSWRRQIGHRHTLAGERGARPFAVIGYRVRGPLVNEPYVRLCHLTLIALFDERLDTGALATRLVGVGGIVTADRLRFADPISDGRCTIRPAFTYVTKPFPVKGYTLDKKINEALTRVGAAARPAPANPDGEPGSVPVTGDDGPANARRVWILSELSKGRELRMPMIAAELQCSTKTAKRDLDVLKSAGRIEFVGPAKTGHYQVKD